MNIGAKFDRFLENIQLTDAQIADAKSKHEKVRDILKRHYYMPGYSSQTSVLIGSYGKSTACRPPTDVDILFIMPTYLFSKYNTYGTNGPSRLLQDVKEVIRASYPNTALSGDGQVVVVSFSENFRVEVAPVFKFDYSDLFTTPDTHEGGSWKSSNPTAEKNNIISCNAISDGKATHLIKMMKVWKHVCNVPIKSLVLELLSVDFVKQWMYRDKTSFFYDYLVRDFFDYLVLKKNSYVIVPGINEFINVGNEWVSKATTAVENAKVACSYEVESSESADISANIFWKRIFGDFFKG